MTSGKPLTIGALAKLTDCKAETIRYYERIGLLPEPARTASGYRTYGPAHAARLAFIRRARELGFGLDAIRDLLDLAADRSRSCADVDRIAQAHLGEIERRIARLAALRDELQRVIGACRRGRVDECRVVEALSQDPVGLTSA